MTPLSSKTILLVSRLFPAEHWTVRALLESECGQNLPFCADSNPEGMERLRFAALKVSAGKMDRLREAVDLAKLDWRDLLVWAEFANDLEAHNKWADAILNSH